MAEYAFNPITGNLDRVGSGSGPGGDITINGDTGAPIVGTNFNFVGQEAGTVPVMEVDTSSGDVAIINNAWQTQYVVDPSTTVGLKGTFQTIQSAIDQIVADGYGVSPFHTILVRPGTYPDPIVLPDAVGINIVSQVPLDEIALSLGVVISGDVSGPGAYVSFQNIFFQGSIDGSAMALFSAKDCNITVIDTGLAGNSFIFSGCAINAGSFAVQSTFRNCILGASSCVLRGDGVINIRDCQIANMTLSASPTIFIFNSTWAQSGNIIGDGTFNGFITVGNCVAPASSALFNNINAGTVSYGNITFPVSASTNRIMAASAVPQFLYEIPSFGGNVKPLYKTAVNFSMTRNYCYVGVTDTSTARTITLPPTSPAGSSPYFGQEFEIKDETGAASVNNITVAGTVDGVSGYTISQNYGSLRVRFDGTTYWSIPGPSAVAGGPFLTVANNLSDLASASTARTNLGLGTAAVQNTGFFLQTANNLSDVPSASTARTNLGLGTAAVQATTFFLQTANNLSDVPSASTARTNLGLGTAAVQNTAFFLQTANNLSDVVASTARTNLGLGTAAQQNNAFFLQTANNLSDVVAATARTNLGLGTAAQQATTFFLQVANNLSDLANAATARSNLGLGSAALINAPIANSDLVNSGITVNVSGGLTGGGAVSLGGSVNIVGPGAGGAYVDGVTGYTDVTGTSQALAVNQGYQANNAGLVTFTLPATAAFGTIIKIRGYGSGGWTVAQNASQQVILGAKGATTSGTGGSVSSTNRYDKISLFCAVANTIWTAEWDGVLTPV